MKRLRSLVDDLLLVVQHHYGPRAAEGAAWALIALGVAALACASVALSTVTGMPPGAAGTVVSVGAGALVALGAARGG